MILLDTHAWVWWVGEIDKLSDRARQSIQEADTLAVSVMSCWELAVLKSKNRVSLSLPLAQWIEQVVRTSDLRILPLTTDAAIAAGDLSAWPHRDPADRMLAATAIALDLPLITADRTLHDFLGHRAVW